MYLEFRTYSKQGLNLASSAHPVVSSPSPEMRTWRGVFTSTSERHPRYGLLNDKKGRETKLEDNMYIHWTAWPLSIIQFQLQRICMSNLAEPLLATQVSFEESFCEAEWREMQMLVGTPWARLTTATEFSTIDYRIPCGKLGPPTISHWQWIILRGFKWNKESEGNIVFIRCQSTGFSSAPPWQ